MNQSHHGFYPHLYTTLSDGLHHPCDAPDIEPQEFFLAVMHDRAIPWDCRIWAMKQVMDLWPEWRPSRADYEAASHMMSLLTLQGSTVQ